MPEEAIARNDAIMVDWFAGWALTQLENFRKFHVIMAPCGGGGAGARGDGGGGPGPGGAYERLRKEWMRKWGHITILTPEEALNLHKIPDAEAKWKADEDLLREKREKEKEKGKSATAGGEQQSREKR
ncbi:hypothetical protein MMC31_001414 [Peltigera leucophlebia]|nr:hypothetical protein [Peltigera leucophlebia]